jgi:hypothetical protein
MTAEGVSLPQKSEPATLPDMAAKKKTKKKEPSLPRGRPPINDEAMSSVVRLRFSAEEYAQLSAHKEKTEEAFSDAIRRGLRKIGILK